MIDESKRVPVLGDTFPLPIEVLPFGWRNTARAIEQFGGRAVRRERNEHVFRTASGHYILDLHIARIDDPAGLEAWLNRTPGVIECGLFVGRTDVLIVGTSHGVEVHTRTA